MKGILVALTLGTVSAALLAEIAIRVLACWMPGIAYLAHAGLKNNRPVATSLQEFLAFPEYQMHALTDFYGYSTNSLGFLDKDFDVPKPAGRKRYLAIGDSFVRGTVPYPHNVITVLEKEVHAKCAEKDFDVLNLGVSGTGPWEYHELLRLVEKQFSPDGVLLHFYLGNDGPDVVHGKDTLPRPKPLVFDSVLSRYLKNSFTLLRATRQQPGPLQPHVQTVAGNPARGGERTALNYDFTDNDIAYRRPTIWGRAWQRIQWDELTHFFKPDNAARMESAWARVFSKLRDIHAFLVERKIDLVIVFYPSELQVDVSKQQAAFESLNKREGKRPLSEKDYDFLLPNRTLLDFCKKQGIRCFDLTEKLAASCAGAGKPCYIPQNTHWNILGNRLAAEVEASSVAPIVCGHAP